MPKFSKTSAASHYEVPGYMDSYEDYIGGWNVSVERTISDVDMAPLFQGGPDDMCPSTHLGYVISGKFGVRMADGTEETYEAGDAFIILPGHTPISYADSEYVSFTTAADAQAQAAIMMPNLMAFAEAHGLQLPAEMTGMASS